jgi:hypothetical protein
MRSHGKEKYQSKDNTKIGTKRVNSCYKNEEVSRGKARKRTLGGLIDMS